MIKESSLHSHYCNIIRRMLKASFVGWVQENEKNSLRVVINKKEHYLPLEGGPIGEETYQKLIKELLNNEQV